MKTWYAIARFASRLSAFALQGDAAAVTRVLVMFKCHLDVGFVDTQAAIMRLYFDHYFPKAIDIGEQMSRTGGDRYMWTTGSWMLYEYLEQANAEQRKRAARGRNPAPARQESLC